MKSYGINLKVNTNTKIVFNSLTLISKYSNISNSKEGSIYDSYPSPNGRMGFDR